MITIRRLAALAALLAVLCVCIDDGADAAISPPVAITKNFDLSFGTYSADPSSTSYVTVGASADTATVSGSAFSFGGTIKRARFTITGKKNQYVIVTLPSSITIRRSGGTQTMTVDNFTMDQTNPIRIPASGSVVVNVGARLRIVNGQTVGGYTTQNTFTVDADYL